MEQIKDWYEHEHPFSVFVMFTKDLKLIYCSSGNELRRIYLLSPDEFISGPLELPLTEELALRITDIEDESM